jgi:flavin-dependent dehydrogenase
MVDRGVYDVAVIGGGPGGSTTGAYLRRYNAELRVLILEREVFPRDHIGESQLPPIGKVLDEIGAWEKVEAAGFPVKLGASYTWGRTTDPWEFEFMPLRELPREFERPGAYDSWRSRVAFQVDRAVYDDILLRHAAELGCEVRQGTRVAKVLREGDRVTGLELEGGARVEARWYVDASGNAAVLRRAMGVKVEAPTKLQNVAFWDYWTDARLNEDLFGHGVTRIQIRSLPYGWLWYIPLSRTRTSAGLVCPAEYYKSCGKRPEQLYLEALKSEPRVWSLLEAATRRGRVDATTDWSFVSERTYGENWYLVGEALGFADPILSAGLTLTHWSGRHCACTILEIERGEQDRAWLDREYDTQQIRRVRQHMRFAEYWYSANGCFADVREFCSQIAKDSGLRLNAQSAFRWLSNGGLDDVPGFAQTGGYSVSSIKQVQHRLVQEGRVLRVPAWRRGTTLVPRVGMYGLMLDALSEETRIDRIIEHCRRRLLAVTSPMIAETQVREAILCLEVMAQNYWVTCTRNAKWPAITIDCSPEGEFIYTAATGPKAAT